LFSGVACRHQIPASAYRIPTIEEEWLVSMGARGHR